MAIEPQLIKSYAQKDYKRMHNLLLVSSKFSFYLLLLLSLPILFNTNIILNWWLSEVPEHTARFVQLVLLLNMILALATPIVRSAEATGRLRQFEIAEMSCTLTILPIAYIGVKFYHFSPETLLFIPVFIEIITQIIRIKVVSPLIKLDIKEYLQFVIYPIIKVSIISPILPLIIQQFISNNSLQSFIHISISCILSTLITVVYIGCNKSERETFIKAIINKIKKK